MAMPKLSNRSRDLDPEKEAKLAAFSAAPDVAPKGAEPPAAAPQATPAEEPKSKGFNWRHTATLHQEIDAMRKADDRSFQWMLDKLIELGIKQWEQGNR